MVEERIQINNVWYVREDLLSKKEHIELNPTHFEGYVVENDEFCFEAHRLFQDDGTPYTNCVSIECTDKRFEDQKDWKVEYWDNTEWMRGILQNEIESWVDLPDMGKNENIEFLQAFLQYLTDKGWL